MTSKAVIGPGNGLPLYSMFELENPSTIDFAADDTYQKITGDWLAREFSYFEHAAGDKLRYLGPNNTPFLFSGSSDLSSSRGVLITYAAFLNDALVESAQSPHTFQTNGLIENLSITAVVRLNTGDEFEVFAKASDADADINIETLRITLWGRGK